MKKRYFLVVVLFSSLFLSLFLSSCVSKVKIGSNFEMHPLAIVQGTTSNEQTFISVLSHKKQGDLKFFVVKEEQGEKPAAKPVRVYSYFKKVSPDERRILEKINITNLDGLYSYKLIVKNKDGVLDERQFKALSVKRRSLRIGVASCMDDRIQSASDMWRSYLNKFSDVNFFIGDNVYADRLDDGSKRTADLEQLWLRYTQTWDRLYFYHSSHLSPTYYLWDDHDYGKNDGGADYKNKKESLELFWAFHPNEEIEGVYQKTVGAGSVLTAFGQKFFFIDGRYFRENQKGVHWGEEQKKLLFEGLETSEANVNWLIQGDQFFGAYHPFESFEKDNPAEFKRVLKALRKTKKKLVFVSGDRHLTEIMKIERPILGYETYEITSSGIHAKVFPGSFVRSPNPRGEVGKSGVYNYSVIELDRDLSKGEPESRGSEKKSKKNPKIQFKVTSYGAKDWTHYTKEISL